MKKYCGLLLLTACMLGTSACRGGQTVSGRLAGRVLEAVLSKEEKSDKSNKKEGAKERGEMSESQMPEETSSAGTDASVQETVQLELSLQKNYTSEYSGREKLLEVTYDTLEVKGDGYPELSAALFDVRQETEQQILDWKQQYLPYAQESMGESYFYAYEYIQTMMLKRADEQVVSFAVQHYDFTGGAHGYTAYQSACFDTATGEKLSLEDVVTDLPRLAEAVIEELEKDYPTEHGEYHETVKNQIIPGRPDSYPATWTLDAEGIVFYYDSYELGAYSMGTPQVMVPYARYPELFAEKYCRVPEEYALRLADSGAQYMDLNGDGDPEEIYVYGVSPQGDTYGEEELRIYINDTLTTYLVSGWFNQAFLIRQKDGSVYLYVSVIESGDWGCIYVFRLEGENAVYIDDTWGHFSSDVLLNPSNFKVYDRLDALGSFEGCRYCRVGSSGLPEPNEEAYTILVYEDENGEERCLTAKIPVPVWMLSADGTPAASPEQLPAGTKLYFRKTDNQHYVEMELEDGRRCQVRGDFSSWPKTINGINEDDCFDGIMYAG